ncbi:MAG TPA: hypothetical protein VNZ52_09040 [Candidatus Thermoplasmatota archaeon]|nr:hypothetical protein [Candidatus Thermoplasmatota archaeon]
MHRALRTLAALADAPHFTPMERLHHLLTIGCVQFRMPLGAVFRTGVSECALVAGLHDGVPLAEGNLLPACTADGRLTALVEVEGRTYGALVFTSLDTDPETVTPRERQFLNLLAEYAGIVVEMMLKEASAAPAREEESVHASAPAAATT